MAIWLGRAGLIPFLALPVLLTLDQQHTELWSSGLATYSLAIICFLLGTWWGLALIKRHPSALVLSNALFLVAFFSYLLLPLPAYLFTASIIFMGLIVIEGLHPLFRSQPLYYRRLRVILSVTASLSLLAAAILSGNN